MRTLLFLMTMTIWSCTGQSQKLNNEIAEAGAKPYLLGKINREGLSSENYNLWFTTGFEEYQPKPLIIKEISKNLSEYTILAFMGTWCGDSRREVPRFYKVLEAAKYPMKQLTTVAVSGKPDMYKQSPNHEEKGLNIHRVPTFIFYKNGKEINRMVEHPVQSIEEDILSIVNGGYISNYQLVTEVNKLIEDKNFYSKALQNIESYKSITANMYELNTYAKILKTTHRNNKALQVLTLNTKLFPENPAVYTSLANFQLQSDKKKEALYNYKKAFELHPKNTKLKNKIDQLKSELNRSHN